MAARRTLCTMSRLCSAASSAATRVNSIQASAHRALHTTIARSSDVPPTTVPSRHSSVMASLAPSPAAPAKSEADGIKAPVALSSKVQYKYFVERAGPMQESLPVYSELRNQGRSRFTIVRRIGGDVQALSHDLLLGLQWSYGPRYHKPYRPRSGRKMSDRPPSAADMHLWGDPTARSPIKVSSVNGVGKLTIAGDRVREVKQWLEERGF